MVLQRYTEPLRGDKPCATNCVVMLHCRMVDLLCNSGYTRAAFLSLIVLMALVQPLGSQETPCTIRKLPVSFRDAQNVPLQRISATDLEGRVHGKPVRILSLAADSRPHRIVLVLDSSGSMGNIEEQPALWNLSVSLARHFFEVNHQRAQMALLLFNNQGTDAVDFGQGSSAVGQKLSQIAEDRTYVKTHIKGRTALRDAIFQAVLLLDHPTSADAVYVLTDGGDNASHRSVGELDSRLAVTTVRVFAVLLQQKLGYRNRTPEEENGPQDLADIVHESGGEILTAAEWHGKGVALSADADAKVTSEEMLNRLYQTILQDSLLEIETPLPLTRNERWELKLSSDARHRWKNAQITYPEMLIGCSAEVSGSGRR